MKPIPKWIPEAAPLLAFGPHPDDIEFGCGGVVAAESISGRPVHLVVCSHGESSSHGSPGERILEAEKAASLLKASLEFLELDGDAHLEVRATHALRVAAILRRLRPALVLAPSLVEHQHPDHPRLGQLVRDAVRLSRYGGVAELQDQPSHTVDHLLYYAVTPEAEPTNLMRILMDISAPDVVATWTAAMEAHASQMSTRKYVEMQLTRARLLGLRVGVEYAVPLFAENSLVFTSLGQLTRGAGRF
jgi:N-acetylglucosamine malate deacetylase 1